jgi:hypothetical protein
MLVLVVSTFRAEQAVWAAILLVRPLPLLLLLVLQLLLLLLLLKKYQKVL